MERPTSPDPQSGAKLLQDGRIDVYALPVLSISDLLKKAEDPSLAMFAPVENTPIFCAGVDCGIHSWSGADFTILAAALAGDDLY